MEEEEAEETAFGGGRPLRPPARALAVCPAGGCDAAPPRLALEVIEFSLHFGPFGPAVVALLAVLWVFAVLARGAGDDFGLGGGGGAGLDFGAVGGLAVGADLEVDRDAVLGGVGVAVGGLDRGAVFVLEADRDAVLGGVGVAVG